MELSSRSYNCPACGGKLVFDTDGQVLLCKFCGSDYRPEKLEILEQIREIDTEDAGESELDKCEIVCDNCGASLITEKDTSATFCTFCGSPAIITGRLKKQFRPDCIIPFKVSREEAREKLISFAKSSKYVPADFFNKDNFDKLTGIYVPYWLLSSRCSVHARGEGLKTRVGFRDKYLLTSDFDIRFENIPFDGSLEISDELMESLEPFDTSELKPFNTSYLQGFYSQKFNLTAENLTDRILVRLEQYGKETASMSFHDYASIKFGACAAVPHDLEQKYALYPIWFLNYNYKGGNYRLAVNGQTGKVDGFLPVSKFKRGLRLLPHRLVDILICILLGTPLYALAFAIYKFIGAFGAGVFSALCFLITLATFYAMFMMRTGNAMAEARGILMDDNSASVFIKPLAKLYLWRRNGYDKLSDMTNMMVGKRPPATEYYDTKAKIEFENMESFVNSENLITGNAF